MTEQQPSHENAHYTGYETPSGHHVPPYPSQYSQPQYHVAPQQEPSAAFGITALVLGILSFMLSGLPLIGLLAILTGIAAIIFGALSVQRKSGKGMGIAGIITGVVGLFVTIALHIFLVILGAAIETDMEYYYEYDTMQQPQLTHHAVSETVVDTDSYGVL